MDTDSFLALRSVAGQRLLADVCATDPAEELAVGTRLRRDHPPSLVSAAFEQAALRRRATTKFGPAASRMYFTRDGLEQASAPPVSEVRFSRLAGAGVATLADLCCGIGGDLVVAARMLTGAVSPGIAAVDVDALTCAVARANLEVAGAVASVVQDNAEDYDVDGYDAVFADPARRGPRGRVWRRDGYRPGWEFVERLMSRRACVKTSPTLPRDAVPSGAEPEWISLDGQVREVCLWSAALWTTERRATVVRSGPDPRSPVGVHSISAADLPTDVPIRPMGRYVHDPDPAVTAAHLVPVVAAHVDGWLLDGRIGYLSSDTPSSSALARTYTVLEELPFKHRRLRAALRQRGVGALTIKKRGVDVQPDELRARLDLRGQESATLLLARTPTGARAYLVAAVE